jgi:hypothetical protein
MAESNLHHLTGHDPGNSRLISAHRLSEIVTSTTASGGYSVQRPSSRNYNKRHPLGGKHKPSRSAFKAPSA